MPEVDLEDTEALVSELQRPRISDFSFFDPLVGAVLDYFEGCSSSEEALKAVDGVDVQIAQVRHAFLHEQKFQEEDERLDQLTADIELMFGWLGQLFPQLSDGIRRNDQHAAMVALMKSRDALEAILVAFGRIREVQASGPSYSESPYLHELCRVGYAVLARRLPAELLQERLQPYIRMHDGFVEQMEGYAPPAAEAAVWAEISDDFYASLERCTEGLTELELYFENGNSRHIESGLARLRAATEEMIALQGRLSTASAQAQEKRCPVCTAMNAPDVWKCANCGANLDLTDTGGALGGEAVLGGIGPNLQDFVELIRSVMLAEVPRETLRPELETQQANLDRVLAFFDELPEEIDEDGEDEAKLAVLAARDALNRGLASVEEALHIVREVVDGAELAQLGSAISLIESCGEHFQSVESFGESVASLS